MNQQASDNTTKCVNVSGTADGSAVTLSECLGTTAQAFRFQNIGSGYNVVNVNSQKCFEVVNGSTAEGAKVQQSSCNGSPNQIWKISTYQ